MTLIENVVSRTLPPLSEYLEPDAGELDKLTSVKLTDVVFTTSVKLSTRSPALKSNSMNCTRLGGVWSLIS